MTTKLGQMPQKGVILTHFGVLSSNSIVITPVASPLPTASFATLNIVLVSAAVALHTIVELTYSFFNVLPPDVGWRVLVAPIAGVAAVIITYMAGHTRGGVVAVQHKVFVVLKRGWRPLLLGVALGTVSGNLLVQRIRR